MQQKHAPWLSLPIIELRLAWMESYGSTPPGGLGKALLARGLAWKEQEKTHGGLAPKIERELEVLSRELETSGAIRVDRRAGLKVGTRLVREWGGETHTVDVMEDGFRYADQSYSSLSTVAQAITGVKWSGPRFFGLKRSSLSKEATSDA